MFQIKSSDSLGFVSAFSQCQGILPLCHKHLLRRARLAPAIVVLGVVLVSGGGAETQTVAPPYSINFEDLKPGNIDGQRGWKVEQGKAEVVAGIAHDGQQSMRLVSGDPFTQAKLTLRASVPPAAVTFVDFWVMPVAGTQREAGELIDVDGARIGFFRSAEEPSMADFWVADGDGKGKGTWIKTNLRVKVDEKTGAPKEWQRITLREDFTRQVWDLRIGGKLAGANLGFQDANIGHTENYIIMGDATESVFLDDLGIQNENPLGLDSDYDGFLNTEEKQLGWQPYFDDRDTEINGVTRIEQLVAAEKNVLGKLAVAPPPQPKFSAKSGLLTDSMALRMESAAAKILYTIDGSDPRISPRAAQVYSAALPIEKTTVLRAIAIDERGRMSATTTGAWIFPSQVVDQARPEQAPAEFVDQSFWHGSKEHFSVPWTMQSKPEEKGAIAESLQSAPIALLATDPEGIFNADTGAYARAATKGLVVPGNLICLAPNGEATSVATAATVSGQSSRYHDVTLKHSLRLRFDDSGFSAAALGLGGSTQLMVLRNSTHDNWALSDLWMANRRQAKYVCEAFANNWMATQGYASYHRNYVHVFLNGSYWGVYEAVEQHDAGYVGRHAEDAFAKAAPGQLVTDLLEPDAVGSNSMLAIIGDAKPWNTLRMGLQKAVRDARSGLAESAVAEELAPLRELIDETNLIDYIIWNCWLGNSDWPERNYLIQRFGGKYQFISWDAEFSMRRSDGVQFNNVARLTNAADGPAFVFCALSHIPEFRRSVLERLAVLQASALAPEVLLKQFESVVAKLAPLMPAEAARWGWVNESPAAGVTQWESNVGWVRQSFIPERTTALSVQFAAWAQRLDENQLTWAKQKGLTPVSLPNSTMPKGAVNIAQLRAAQTDTDQDSLPDEWEIANGLDPKNGKDALQDSDGDGLSNVEEFLLGTNPQEKNQRSEFVRAETGGVHTKMPLRVKPSSLSKARLADSPEKATDYLEKAIQLLNR